MSVLNKRVNTIKHKTLDLLITEENFDHIKLYLETQFDRHLWMPAKEACLNSYLHFQTTTERGAGTMLLVDRTSRIHGDVISAGDFFFFNAPWWEPDEVRVMPNGELVWTSSDNSNEATFVGDTAHYRRKIDIEDWREKFVLVYSKAAPACIPIATDSMDALDTDLDFDVPDVDIEYQEDDGSSDCADGACKI